MYQRGGFALLQCVNTMIPVGSGTVSAVGMTDQEAIERAVTAEFAARVKAYGGTGKYTRDFGIDKRNFARYIAGTRAVGLPQIMQLVLNLGITHTEFFESVDERVRRGE